MSHTIKVWDKFSYLDTRIIIHVHEPPQALPLHNHIQGNLVNFVNTYTLLLSSEYTKLEIKSHQICQHKCTKHILT